MKDDNRHYRNATPTVTSTPNTARTPLKGKQTTPVKEGKGSSFSGSGNGEPIEERNGGQLITVWSGGMPMRSEGEWIVHKQDQVIVGRKRRSRLRKLNWGVTVLKIAGGLVRSRHA